MNGCVFAGWKTALANSPVVVSQRRRNGLAAKSTTVRKKATFINRTALTHGFRLGA